MSKPMTAPVARRVHAAEYQSAYTNTVPGSYRNKAAARPSRKAMM